MKEARLGRWNIPILKGVFYIGMVVEMKEARLGRWNVLDMERVICGRGMGRNERSPFRALKLGMCCSSHWFYRRNERSPFRALKHQYRHQQKRLHQVEMKEARLGRWNNPSIAVHLSIAVVEMKEARLGRWNTLSFLLPFIRPPRRNERSPFRALKHDCIGLAAEYFLRRNERSLFRALKPF